MTYAQYLSKHSYFHMLSRYRYAGIYLRLDNGLSSVEYERQIADLQRRIAQ